MVSSMHVNKRRSKKSITIQTTFFYCVRCIVLMGEIKIVFFNAILVINSYSGKKFSVSWKVVGTYHRKFHQQKKSPDYVVVRFFSTILLYSVYQNKTALQSISF